VSLPLPLLQVGEAMLHGYQYCLDAEEDVIHSDTRLPAKTLLLEGVQPLASLQRLLDALLPPRAVLEGLRVDNSELELAALRRCSHLGALRSLHLEACFGGHDSLRSLLRQATQLTSFGLRSEMDEHLTLTNLPPTLAGLRTLARLCLPFQQLSQLPAGPYLSGALSWQAGWTACGWVHPAGVLGCFVSWFCSCSRSTVVLPGST
jgi:hypothetical protein